MLNIVLIVAVLLHIILSEALGGYSSIRKMKKIAVTESRKIKTYKSTILNGWGSVAFTIGVVVLTDITPADLGLKMIDINFKYFNVWVSVGILAVCFGFMLLLIYQMVAFNISNEYRKKLQEQLEKKTWNDSVDLLLPKTNREKKWWSIVSVTAGIGEELYYRGLLLYLVMSIFPNLSIYFILIAIGIIFGIAHSYQGFSGILKTALMGLMFCAVYFVTGSIIPGMLIHFVMDFASNFLFYDQPKAPSVAI